MSDQYPDPGPFIEKAHEILEEAKARKITLRLIGALAFHIRCPEFNYIQIESERYFTDIDFMGYYGQIGEVEQLFLDMGYADDRRIKSVPGLRRSIFFHPTEKWHSDVFYDVLEFSHELDFRGRLELDYPTITLGDLLLEKMQIVQINEKDIIDTLMLLREHETGVHDDAPIQAAHVARTCKADWGLWKTVTTNLEKVHQLADRYEVLTDEDREVIRGRLGAIVDTINEHPATLRWRLRGSIGERMKWYRDVDEVK